MNTVNIGGPGMFHCARFSSSSSEGIATVEVKQKRKKKPSNSSRNTPTSSDWHSPVLEK